MVARRPGALVLALCVLGGAFTGSLISEALAQTWWIFARSAEAGLRPSTLNLVFFNITFGFQIRLSLGTLLGLLAGLILYRRLVD